MKKKKSTFLTLLLSLSLCLSLAWGCDLGAGADDAPPTQDETQTPDDGKEDGGEIPTPPPVEIVTADMSIHFLEFQNLVSGDCTLIKVGDTEVLIDAGSTRGATRVTIPYLQQYCTDGVLEYVIATHAHEDHISGFVGLEEEDRDFPTDGQGVFEAFECRTIIDYTARKTNSKVSQDYELARDQEILEHGGNHYTALECWNNENGARRTYELGEGITMNILYQKFYETSTSTENNYSVCLMISQGDNHYLFTGDLEKTGEESLVEKNTLPKCKVYKGGHHGSRTSNTTALLSVIQPEIVCVCSCCGDKNDFIHQEFIDNVALYTDQVYVTTMRTVVDGAAKSMPLNGNIVVTCKKEEISVKCSNNDLLFKESVWFLEQVALNTRTCPDAWKEE